MARAEEVMHQVEQRAEKMEKLRRELEELMQPVDGVAEARGRWRSVARRCQLVEAIQQLGHLPTQSKNSSQAEKTLAVRLIRARKADLRKAWEVRKSQQRAAARIAKAEEVTQQVRDIGRCRKENERCSLSERALAAKLRKARKAKLLSPEQEAELQALQARKFEQRAAARIAKAEEVMQEVRDLGRYPKRTRRSTVEGKLAIDVFTARRFKQFSPEQEAELETFKQAESHAREAARIADVERMMQEVRSLRRYPKEGAGRSPAEQQLAEKTSPCTESEAVLP